MTNTYDEYADKAAARYLQGRMDEQAAWVEAVQEMLAWYRADAAESRDDGKCYVAAMISARAAALDALLRRMGVE